MTKGSGLVDLNTKVAVIQNEMKEQTKDIARLEKAFDDMRRGQSSRQVFFYLAALLPVYALLLISVLVK